MSNSTCKRAAQWLLDHDWCQNTRFVDEDGLGFETPGLRESYGACALGAIDLVSADEDEQHNAVKALAEQLNEKQAADVARMSLAAYGERHECYESIVARWNDRPGRNVNQVIDELEEA